MRRSAKIAILRYRGMRSNFDFVHTVAIGIMRQAAIIAHLEVPWRPYPATRIDRGATTHLRSKEPQEKTSPSTTHFGARPEKHKIHNLPQRPRHFVRKTMRARTVRDINLGHCAVRFPIRGQCFHQRLSCPRSWHIRNLDTVFSKRKGFVASSTCNTLTSVTKAR